MPLTSPIKSYDPTWPQQYAAEEARLNPVFGSGLIRIHHVGSTAVPGLAAKAEIDVLVVIRSDDGLDDWSRSLTRLGYRRGGDLSRGHHFFSGTSTVSARTSFMCVSMVMNRSHRC